MGPGHDLQLGGLHFTKTGLMNYCKSLLVADNAGIVVDRHHELWAFLWDLLQLHPDKTTKIGCGVHYFCIVDSAVPPFPRSMHFELVRTNGSRTDFSYRRCVDSKPAHSVAAPTGTAPSRQHPARFYYMHLRETVAYQLRRFKAQALKIGPRDCPVNHSPITKHNARVGYLGLSFHRLVTGWLSQEGIVLSGIVTSLDDNTADKQIACPSQRQSWQQYHRQHARLQLLSKAGYQQLAASEAAAAAAAAAADHEAIDQVVAGIASLSVA